MTPPNNVTYSVASILSVICALGSFLSGAILGMILALLAILFGVVGMIIALSPGKRGGIASFLAVLAGGFGIVAAFIKAILFFL